MILTGELAKAKSEIEEYARDYKLDFFPMILKSLSRMKLTNWQPKAASLSAIRTGASEWNLSSSTKAIPTACKKSMRWLLIQIRAMPT